MMLVTKLTGLFSILSLHIYLLLKDVLFKSEAFSTLNKNDLVLVIFYFTNSSISQNRYFPNMDGFCAHEKAGTT